MSTILEALKRSEAERAARSGAAPIVPLRPQRRPASRWLLLTLLAAMAGATVWHLINPMATTNSPPDHALRDPEASPDVTSQQPAAAPVETSDAQTRPVAQPRSNASTPTETHDQVMEDNAENAAQQDPARVVESTPTDTQITVVTLPKREPAEVATPSAPDRAPGPRLDARALPPVETLGYGPALQALGQLTVNVHKYSDDPAQRFLLVNLRRRVEGDELAPGITIDEIQPASIVVSVDDARYEWRPAR